MINLRKEGDKIVNIEDVLEEAFKPFNVPKEAEELKNNFDPTKGKSEFYKKLERIVLKNKSGERIKLSDSDSAMTHKYNKDMETTKLPNINDALKKINVLMTSIGISTNSVGNGHYLSALSQVSTMLVDVKESVEKRDRKLLGLIHSIEDNQRLKNALLELLNSEQ